MTACICPVSKDPQPPRHYHHRAYYNYRFVSSSPSAVGTDFIARLVRLSLARACAHTRAYAKPYVTCAPARMVRWAPPRQRRGHVIEMFAVCVRYRANWVRVMSVCVLSLCYNSQPLTKSITTAIQQCMIEFTSVANDVLHLTHTWWNSSRVDSSHDIRFGLIWFDCAALCISFGV